MRGRICFTGAILLAVTGLSAGPAQAAPTCVYVVDPPYPADLWVRSGPGTQYEQVDDVAFGATVEGTCRTSGDWTAVWGSNGFHGWAYSAYLDEIG
ncbi:SH3 domain-containing protein [Nonomuraea africana]|uniref:Uncharacterized protein YraI n=1 Tax=Nonomuraea africana TaxID=46171 RepID=A0ABR9KBQ7_9ACTN|nr:SH3 domain-containing protein [Nonomuraea africana]MBE1559443.1 uncharacterized protein YraI [Nonomuraea africana]